MALTRQQKGEAIEKMKQIFKDSVSTVFVHFKGLSVSDSNEMRGALRGEGVQYSVVKKSLAKRALAESGVEGTVPELPGELAVAYGDDLVAPARLINESAKKNKDQLSIMGGIFEGRFMNQEEMTAIAAIPPMPVLYGQFVNLISSPIQGLVMALGQIAEKKQ